LKYIWTKYKRLILISFAAAMFCFFYFDIPAATYFGEMPSQTRDYWKDITVFGDSKYSLIAGLLVWIIFKKIDRISARTGLFVFSSVALSGILVDIFKWIFGRYRPVMLFNEDQYGFTFFKYTFEYVSFPSGHSATAFALGTAFALLMPKGKWFFMLLAAGVAFSRVAINKHYLSDIIIGSLFGFLTAVYLFRGVFSDLKQNSTPASPH
jgi:membrane-associated phospholipid phosphatase